MKKASIVSVGNELLNGHTTDTNTAYISGRLIECSIPVVSAYIVGDDASDMKRAFERAADDGDIVIITGGLGPTDDDLTRQVLADYFGVDLVLDERLLAELEDFFKLRQRPMAVTNRIQAFMPSNCTAIPNKRGTAPGIFAEFNGKLYFSMPSVPFEMELMVEDFVLPKLKPLAAEQNIVTRKLRCFGIGESNIAAAIGDIMRRDRNPLINSTAGGGIITLHVVSSAENIEDAKSAADEDVKTLKSILGLTIFGEDDQTLASVTAHMLDEQNKTLALAESCTGGMLGSIITEIPGASKFFTHGWVTYSNEAKISELSVPRELIESHGAVSSEVAAAMAQGARKRAGSDYAIAITGIAGPGGGTEKKPVGTVFIALATPDNIVSEKYVFPTDRKSVRYRAALTALNMLRLALRV